MRLATIPLSLLIVLSVLVITEQQEKAQITYYSSRQNPVRMNGALDKFEKRSSAKKTKLCHMNVIGLSDTDAIYVLGLNESKVNK
jgi:hypothetical protein